MSLKLFPAVLGPAVCAAALLVSTPAHAQYQSVEKGPIGIGLIVGEPTGISAKLYLDDQTAIDGALGLAAVSSGFHVHADYLLHPWILTEEENFVMPVYVGPGARLLSRDTGRGTSNDFHVGARAAGGVAFDFKNVPIDVFLEVALVVDWVFSDTDDDDGIALGLNGGAGVRYYF